MNPTLRIDLNTLTENARTVFALCAEHGIDVTAVTKVFCGEPEIVAALSRGGATRFGDSRAANVRRYSHIPGEKWLIRLPMPSEADAVVAYCDVSLNSETAAVRALNSAAGAANKRHKVILMVELGDIREGILDERELLDAADEIMRMRSIELYGIGTNLSCLSFVRPDEAKLRKLSDLRAAIEKRTGSALAVVSGGNSVTLNLMLGGGVPPGVNNLRLGESVLFGKERDTYTRLAGTRDDAFILEAEIIELKEKPSLPWGTFGCDSYGNKPAHNDIGVRRRAICAVGRQDTDFETMSCADRGAALLGGSSDHMLVDVTDCERQYKAGDTLRFKLGYFALMRAMTSQYVKKDYLR